MKKLLVALTVFMLAIAFTLPLYAASAESEVGFEASPIFEDSGWGSWENQNNTDVRFDTDTGRMAVPGSGGENSDDNSVIIEWHDASLVDPHRTFE
jgi:hypothetical protein